MNAKTVHQMNQVRDINLGGTTVRGVWFRGQWVFHMGKVSLALGYQWERGLPNLSRRCDGFQGFVLDLDRADIHEVRSIDPTFARANVNALKVLTEEGVCFAAYTAETKVAAQIRRDGIPGLAGPGELERVAPEDGMINAPPANTQTDGTIARRFEFEGRTVTAVYFRDRWVWPAAQAGEAIGYKEGRYLVNKIREDWREEFEEGKDYELLKGADLKVFLDACGDSPQASTKVSQMLVLTESGIDLALVLAKTEKGRRLRRMLVDHILPQLRTTGTATLPGAPKRSAVETLHEQTLRLLAQTAEQNATLIRQNSETLQVLVRRVEAIETRPAPRMPTERIDNMEERVGHVEKDVASGIIGSEIAEREILVPLRLLSADKTNPGKLNVSLRMHYDKRMRNELEFNGRDKRWEKLERSKLGRAQQFIGRLMRESDEDRRRQVREAQAKVREARKRGESSQTVIDFDDRKASRATEHKRSAK